MRGLQRFQQSRDMSPVIALEHAHVETAVNAKLAVNKERIDDSLDMTHATRHMLDMVLIAHRP